MSWNKGKGKIYICKNCGKEIKNTKGVYRKFCSSKCCGEYTSKIKYKNYLENQEDFKGREINYQWLKPIILREQNNVCSICDSQLDTYKARNIGHSTRKYKPYRIY